MQELITTTMTLDDGSTHEITTNSAYHPKIKTDEQLINRHIRDVARHPNLNDARTLQVTSEGVAYTLQAIREGRHGQKGGDSSSEFAQAYHAMLINNLQESLEQK